MGAGTVAQIEPAPALYGDGEGYDAYMGHWSAALAPVFLDFADAGDRAGEALPGPVLDVGCGTGNLLAALRARQPAARLVGLDPSAPLLARARARPALRSVELTQGSADHLPFGDGGFTACLSLLVLQEFHGRPEPLREMWRVTAPGGTVAACQWDFARMPVIAALVEALVAIGAGAHLAIRGLEHFNDEQELAAAWSTAGMHEVSAARIAVARRYGNFDELWASLLGGSTPSTLTLAGLDGARRDAVREMMRTRFAMGMAGSGLTLTAEAIAVRGRA